MTSEEIAQLPQNQITKQQIIPSKKISDLVAGDVVGEEDEMGSERYYGFRCRSERGQLLKISIDKFVGISKCQEKTYQQILSKKKNVRLRVPKQQIKIQPIEYSTIDSNFSQATNVVAMPELVSAGDLSPIDSTENLTILSSYRQSRPKNVIHMMQSKNTSQTNISLIQIQESKQNSEHDLSIPQLPDSRHGSQEDLSVLHYHTRPNSIEANSPSKKLYKSASQNNISSNDLKCIPISFRMEYIKSKRKLEQGLELIKKTSKVVSPEDQIKMIKQNLRAEQRELSFEKFSEEAFTMISKDIRKNHSKKFWHQMKNQCSKLGIVTKKFINEEQNQYIRQDPSEEARPLVRKIQKKIDQLNSQNEQKSLENSLYMKRFASAVDLSSPSKKLKTPISSSQLFSQSPQKQSLIRLNSREPSSFTDAIKVEKNLSQTNLQNLEQKDESSSPVRIPSAIKRLSLGNQRSSLGDIYSHNKIQKPVYMSPFLGHENSIHRSTVGISPDRRHMLSMNRIQQSFGNKSSLENSHTNINVEENKVMVIQSNENHNKFQAQSVQITPAYYYNRQKRQLIQKTISQEPSLNKSNNVTTFGSPSQNQQQQQMLSQQQQNMLSQQQQQQHQQLKDFNESPVRSAIQSIYSPVKKASKTGMQIPIADYSQISRKYQGDKEENSKIQLLNRFITSYSQTSQKLKSLNTVMKKKEM